RGSVKHGLDARARGLVPRPPAAGLGLSGEAASRNATPNSVRTTLIKAFFPSTADSRREHDRPPGTAPPLPWTRLAHPKARALYNRRQRPAHRSEERRISAP